MSEHWPNFYEIAGNPSGELLRREYPGGPVDVLRAAGDDVVRLPEVIVDVPAGVRVADAFKLSGARNLIIDRLVVRSEGEVMENAWDSNNRCLFVSVLEADLQAGRQNAMTWKGGCREFRVDRLTVRGHGGHCDLEAGNFSDQARERSNLLSIGEAVCDGGRALRYRVGYADNVQIHHGPTAYQTLPSLFLKAYVPLKQRLKFLP